MRRRLSGWSAFDSTTSTLSFGGEFGQLQHGSTLALAVLVQWLRQTPNAQGLHFQDVPEKMLKIIQPCHLQDDLTLLTANSFQ
jgi:hypothetical protein